MCDTKDLKIRLIPAQATFDGIAASDWQIVGMLNPNSCFAHVIFSGSAQEAIELISELNGAKFY